MTAGKKYAKADTEPVAGHLIIHATTGLLLFDFVFCGNIYELEGRTLIVMFAKTRLFVEVLLLPAIGVAGTNLFYIFSEVGLFYLQFMAGLL